MIKYPCLTLSFTAALHPLRIRGADVLLLNPGHHRSASKWWWQSVIFRGPGYQDLPATPGWQPPGRRAGGISRRDWPCWNKRDATTHPWCRSWDELLTPTPQELDLSCTRSAWRKSPFFCLLLFCKHGGVTDNTSSTSFLSLRNLLCNGEVRMPRQLVSRR